MIIDTISENTYFPEVASQNYCLEQNQPERPVWLKWLVGGALGIMLVAILVGSGPHFLGSLLAWVNCLLVFWAIIKLAEKRSLCCIFPIAFMAWLIIGGSIAPIYFSIFNREATYLYSSSMLKGNVKYQFVIMSFIVPYILLTMRTFRNERPYTPMPPNAARRLNFVVLGLFTFSALVFIIIQAFHLPGVSYAGTFLSYTICLTLVLGVNVRSMSKRFKIILICYFAMMLFFFALANARRYALYPVIAFVFGIFFLSTVPNRTKVIILLICLFTFPPYLVIANTVRTLTGEAGFNDLGYRFQTLKDWRYASRQVSWADSFFGRMFFTGGHAVITQTPEEVAYIGFDPARYLYETALSFIPGKLMEHMTFYIQTKYAYNFALLNYGFNLTEEHQVGITLLGHFWMLGGLPFMIFGAAALALVQWIVCIFITRFLVSRPEKGLFCAGFVFQAFLVSSGRVFILLARELFWQTVLAVVFYYVFVWLFLSRSELPESQEIDVSQLQYYSE